MPLRKSWETNNSTYSNDADVAQIEYELAVILYICGLDGSNPDAYEIDAVVNKIKEVFRFKDENSPGEPVVVPGHDVLAAPVVFIKKLSRQLTIAYRRNHRWRKISKHAGDLS